MTSKREIEARLHFCDYNKLPKQPSKPYGNYKYTHHNLLEMEGSWGFTATGTVDMPQYFIFKKDFMCFTAIAEGLDPDGINNWMLNYSQELESLFFLRW